MKTKLLTLAFAVVFGVTATGAIAAKGPKPERAACKAPRGLVMKGAYVAAGEGTFTMDVSRTNAHGRKLAAKKGVVLKADEKTKYVRDGAAATIADLKAGDRLNVLATLCKGADAETTELRARRVVAKSATA
jgi:hypothetical protein